MYFYDKLRIEALLDPRCSFPLAIVQLQYDLCVVLGDEIKTHYKPGTVAFTLLEKQKNEQCENVQGQATRGIDVSFVSEDSTNTKKFEIDEYHAIRLLLGGSVIAAGFLLWVLAKFKS